MIWEVNVTHHTQGNINVAYLTQGNVFVMSLEQDNINVTNLVIKQRRTLGDINDTHLMYAVTC